MDNLLEQLGISTLGVLLLLIIGYIIKVYLDNRIEKIAERKNILFQKEVDKELEEFKNSLDVLKQERNIVFNSLHVRRSKIIEELYQKLVKLDGKLFNWTIPLKSGIDQKDLDEQEKKQRLEVYKLLSDFNDFFVLNKIYFTSNTCNIIEDIKRDIQNIIRDYEEKDFFKAHGYRGKELGAAFQKATKAWDKVRNEIPKAKKVLEDDFRKMLGVPLDSE